MDKRAKKRNSILKPEKPRTTLGDLLLDSEKVEETEPATRRVRFSSNFVKPFTTEDNNTIWDNTYEEAIEKSEESGVITDNCSTFNYTKQVELSKSYQNNYGNDTNDLFEIAPKKVVLENSYCKNEIRSIFTSKVGKVIRLSDLNDTTIGEIEPDDDSETEVCEGSLKVYLDEKDKIEEPCFNKSGAMNLNPPQVETKHTTITDHFEKTNKNNLDNTKLLATGNETSKKLLLAQTNLFNITKKSVLFQGVGRDKENNQQSFMPKVVGEKSQLKGIFSEIEKIQTKTNNFGVNNSEFKENNPNFALSNICELEEENLFPGNKKRRTIIFNQDYGESNMDITCLAQNIDSLSNNVRTNKSPLNIYDDDDGTQNMEFTCAVPSKIILQNMELLSTKDQTNKSLYTGDMSLDITCQSHLNINDDKTQNMEFTCQAPNIDSLSNKVRTNKSPFNIYDDDGTQKMEFTCAVPSKIILQNMEPLSNKDQTNKSLYTGDMSLDITCQSHLNINDDKTQNMEFTCQAPNIDSLSNKVRTNKSPFNIYDDDGTQKMEFTCAVPSKIILQNMEPLSNKDQTNKSLYTGDMSLDITCQPPLNIYDDDKTQNMEFTCQAPNTDLLRNKVRTNKSPLNIYDDDGTKNMEMTCAVPSKIIVQNMEPLSNKNQINKSSYTCDMSLDITCQQPLNINDDDETQNMDFTSTLPKTSSVNLCKKKLEVDNGVQDVKNLEDVDDTTDRSYVNLDFTRTSLPGMKIICTKPESIPSQTCKHMNSHSKRCEEGCVIHQKSPFIKKKGDEATYKTDEYDEDCSFVPETPIHLNDTKTCNTEIAPMILVKSPEKSSTSFLQNLKALKSPTKKMLDFKNNFVERNNRQDDSLGLINLSNCEMSEGDISMKLNDFQENSHFSMDLQNSNKKNTPKSDFSKILYGECVESALIDPNLLVLSSSGNSFDIDSSGLNILNNSVGTNYISASEMKCKNTTSLKNYTCEKKINDDNIIHEDLVSIQARDPRNIRKSILLIENDQNKEILEANQESPLKIVKSKEAINQESSIEIKRVDKIFRTPPKINKSQSLHIENCQKEESDTSHFKKSFISDKMTKSNPDECIFDTQEIIDDQANQESPPKIVKSKSLQNQVVEKAAIDQESSIEIKQKDKILRRPPKINKSKPLHIENCQKEESETITSHFKKSFVSDKIVKSNVDECISDTQEIIEDHALEQNQLERAVASNNSVGQKNLFNLDVHSDSFFPMYDALSVEDQMSYAKEFLNSDFAKELDNEIDIEIPSIDFLSATTDFISRMKKEIRNAIDEKENPKCSFNLEEASIYERVLEHVKLNKKSFNEITCVENRFQIKTFCNMLQVTADVDCEAEVIGNIFVVSFTNEETEGLFIFLIKIFLEKLEKKVLTSSVGENFSIFTLLDYISLQCKNLNSLAIKFLSLEEPYGVSMDKDLRAICTFNYRELLISCYLIIDCTDIHKISHEKLTIADNKIGNFSDFEIMKIAKQCGTGFQFIIDLPKKVDQYFRSKFKTY